MHRAWNLCVSRQLAHGGFDRLTDNPLEKRGMPMPSRDLAGAEETAPRKMSVWHAGALRAEKIWDKYRYRSRRKPDDITFVDHRGFSTPGGCIIRGRVLNHYGLSSASQSTSRIKAAINMARNFITRELADVEVVAGGNRGLSDEEGYFALEGPALPPGRQEIEVELPAAGVRRNAIVHVTDPRAAIGVISDIDDTVLKTGAYFALLNFWTTITTAASRRKTFADTVSLIRTLCGTVNPVFYVSSSPWNLHAYLQTIFAANGVPDGPMFLRDLGLSEDKFIKSSHGSHKGEAIDTILAANPSLKFILIGDTGQHDATVYLDAIRRHPGRIVKVILRQAGRPDSHDAGAQAKLAETGVGLFVGADLSDPAAARFEDRPLP